MRERIAQLKAIGLIVVFLIVFLISTPYMLLLTIQVLIYKMTGKKNRPFTYE